MTTPPLPSLRLAARSALLALAACGDDDRRARRRRRRADGTVRLLTHDSFLLSDGVLDAFTEETGIEVEVHPGRRRRPVVNQAILTNGNPQADVLFGIDSTFLTRALDDGPVRAVRGRRASTRSTRRCSSTPSTGSRRSTTATCASTTTRRTSRSTTCAVPAEPRRPHRPAYARPARGREPGHLVAGPRVPPGQHRGLRRGRLGGVVERPARPTACRWSTAGRRPTTSRSPAAAASEGDRPLVVSYASSPPAEVLYADPPDRRAAHRRDRRELLPPGRGRRHPRRHRPRGGGRPARSTSCSPRRCRPTCRCRCSCSRRVDGRRAARGVRRSTPRTPDGGVRAARRRRSTPTGRTGSTGGPTSCCGDRRRAGRPPCWRRRVAFLLCFFAWPVVNIVGEGLRGDTAGTSRGVGEVLGDPGLRQVAWFTAVAGGGVHRC